MRLLVRPKAMIALVVWAFIGSLLAGYFAASLEKRYLDHHPYFFDPVSYSFHNAKLYRWVQEAGRTTVAFDELTNNARHPLRTVPLILFAPKLLSHPFGHMATALPALVIFVLLLAYTLYLRAGRLVHAIAGSSMVFLLPGLYSPVSGIAAYWLDLTAALLVGSAVLALLNSKGGRDLRWLALFAVLGSCAAFARFVSIAYLLFASTPVLLWYLLGRARAEGNWPQTFLRPLLIVASTGVVVAGPYLFGHLQFVSDFYRLYGYALGTPVTSSVETTWQSLREFVGAAGVLATIVMTSAWLVTTARERRFDAATLAVPAWLAVAIPILLVFVLRTSATHTISYAVVLLVVVITLPWSTSVTKGQAVLGKSRLVSLLVLSAGWAGFYTSARMQAVHPSDDAVQVKALQTELADRLAGFGPKVVWSAYFDEISWLPSVDAFYRHGSLPLPLGQDYVFSIHETVYNGNYPGWPPLRIYEALRSNANTWLNVAVVLDDPTDAERFLKNDLSKGAARYIADSVRRDRSWIRSFEIDTPRYGRLAGYVNTRPRHDNYLPVLSGKAALGPE